MYILKADLEARFKQPFLDEQLGDAISTQWETINKQILEKVAAYCRHWYDTDVEFENVGDDRNQMLVGIASDLIIYQLHKSGTARNIPQIWIDAYDMAMSDLKDIQRGRVQLKLTVNTIEDEEDVADYPGQETPYGDTTLYENYADGI